MVHWYVPFHHARLDMSEYVVRLLDGTVVECETPEAVRKLVGKLPGLIAKAGPGSKGTSPLGAKPIRRQKKRPRSFRSPGMGPKKLWSMAILHAVETGQTKNDARTALSKLKKEDRRAFLDKEEAHAVFLNWYMKKAKTHSVIEAMDALQIMFDEQNEDFVALVEEFAKKKPAGRRRAE